MPKTRAIRIWQYKSIATVAGGGETCLRPRISTFLAMSQIKIWLQIRIARVLGISKICNIMALDRYFKSYGHFHWAGWSKNHFAFLTTFWPTQSNENDHNSWRNGRRNIILYIFEMPETRAIRIWIQILIWLIAKKVDFFEFGANKKFANKIVKHFRSRSTSVGGTTFIQNILRSELV